MLESASRGRDVCSRGMSAPRSRGSASGGFCSWGMSAPGGGSLPLGVSALGGGCLLLGVSALGGCGVCSWEGVWCLLLGGGVVSVPGGCLLWGVSAPGGCVCSGGGGIPACTEADTPPLWTESQMPVKTLPWPNFVAAGKNS